MVTHRSTILSRTSLTRGEQTGSSVFLVDMVLDNDSGELLLYKGEGEGRRGKIKINR